MNMLRRQSKQKETMVPEIDFVLQEISLGKQKIVAHNGVSQYRPLGIGGGMSACGLAALNCARIVFGKEDEGVTGNNLLHDLLTRQTAEEITSICSHWTSSFHLDMEDIVQVPLFSASLTLVGTPAYYSGANLKSFKKLLQDMQTVAPSSSVAAMITRPPEIVACLKIHRPVDGDVFVIFDSHTRPIHPQGAGFILNISADETAKYLTDLLEVDKRLLPNGGDARFQWQVDLMRHFSAHIVVSKHTANDLASLTQTVLEASLTILTLKAELSAMKQDNSFMASENEKLKKSIDRRNSNDQHSYRSWPSGSTLEASTSDRGLLSSPKSNGYRQGQRKAPSTLKTTAKLPTVTQRSDEIEDKDLMLAIQLQYDLANDRDSIERAIIEQTKYEEEDRRLAAERKALTEALPRLFKCGICLDEHLEDSAAQITQCHHMFCRDCVREHIRSKLGEHLFPILCPICVAEKGPSDPGVISDALIRQIGINEEEYAIFEELQISAYSIMLHCRKCQQTMFVDREEYQGTKILVCPLPGCRHVWCKQCQQSVDTTGPQHSCDGSSELQHLMQRSGWKYCPGCNTPIQKESGCNHMTCMSPGCNTHFCYKCGNSIIKSALAREIKIATSAHYRQCNLFEYS